MSADWADDPTAKVWLRHVIEDMVPKMASSQFVISLFPSDGGEGDAKYWVELGASIMMNKPILVVVTGDAAIPAKLELIADEIVRLPDGVNAAASGALAAAIERMAKP